MNPSDKELMQGTPEWLALRKTKITATDASVILGVSQWKTPLQLYNEKISEDVRPSYINDSMQRGINLEPLARYLFCVKTNIMMTPKVVVKEWAMASLDGISSKKEILEVKCPGKKDHAIAISGKVPEHYYPQIQHQMYVCDSEKAFYFSFDGIDGVTVEVERNDTYIEKMVEEEKKFYECLMNKTPPEPCKNDFIERNDVLWKQCALSWRSVVKSKKELEIQEENLRKKLIELAGNSNSRGAGLSLVQFQRKGNIQYSKIECLKNMDLEPYRDESTTSWRITII